MRPRAVVIRNPNARRALPVERLLTAAQSHAPSWDVEVRTTSRPDEPSSLVRAAIEGGATAILACGGDGTLNSVVNAVRALGAKEVAVGAIPAGTANVWAHEAEIPRSAEGALALLEHGARVSVDLGVARSGVAERAFLLMAGLGLDAAVVARVDARPRLKRRIAQGAFVLAGAGALRSQRPVVCTIVEDGAEGDPVAVRRSVLMAVAGNTRLYGGVTRLASAAEMDDGLLDLVTFEARAGLRGLLDAAVHLGRTAGRLRRGWAGASVARVAYQRSGRFEVHPERALPVQLDGEFFATCDAARPLTLHVERHALQVLVPAGPNPLWRSA